MDTETVTIALRSAKPRKPRKSTLATKDETPRPLLTLNPKIIKSRVIRSDWFHEDMFVGQSIDDVLADSQESTGRPDHVGYYFITLTMDRNKSPYVENGRVLVDKLFMGLEKQVKKNRKISLDKRFGFTVRSGPFAIQMDLHDDGFPHLHVLTIARTDAEIAYLQEVLKWWNTKHGNADVRILSSKVDIVRSMQYLFQHRRWHDNVPQHTGLDRVGYQRSLGFVFQSGLPRVILREIVASGEGKCRPRPIPAYVGANGALHPIALSGVGIKSIEDLSKKSVRAEILSSYKGGYRALGVLGCVIHTATSVVSTPVRNVLIERLTSSSVVEMFLSVWRKGGANRALTFLLSQVSGTDDRFAWRSVEVLHEDGLRCGVRVVTTQGSRVEWDLDVTPMVGVYALSPEQVRQKKLLRAA